ncbi:antibiotic biosynthesis monooxygenase [Paenibacillus faecis]|uniref:Antibiotic biosynthesis monooxygenase n=1 Tax=Paenibacillus faecis TaxID=862114 RepID=A0A5D0CUA4_9BACL|nr:putative quinol monooxygenase [Paenibacillus faecis]TYA13462.1 antibiotic biosynthesis monooxygenase [Paenibacillus faecis]
MNKFGMTAKLVAHEGRRDALLGILLEAAQAMKTVDGCELYAINVDDGDPDSIWIMEIWRDADAHAASLNLEATQAVISKGRPFIAKMEGTRLRVVGGLGV